jgi:circadian clock protein KaiC
MATKHTQAVQKLTTGITGLDLITQGGLPRGRATLLSGTAGSAKTVFAAQFLAAGIASGQKGVFVTFEESVDDIRRNMLGFSWDIRRWEEEGRWGFVDGSPRVGDEPVVAGSYDLGALLARIENAVRKISADRVSLDSLGGIFTQFTDASTVRNELLRVGQALKQMGVTSVITAERTEEFGDIARFGVEEFVADNVIVLRNVLDQEKRRRTMEVLKLRGTGHQKGEYPFTVTPAEGIVVIPLSAIELKQRSSSVRITSGSAELDRMCGGGFFRDSC